MTNNVLFRKDRFLLLRRIITVTAFSLSCVCLVLLLCGFVLFRGRSMSVIEAVNNVFEFVNFGKRPFWFCVSCIVFSVVYGIVVVKNIIDIVFCAKNAKKWIVSEVDDGETRVATRCVVERANQSLWRLLLVFVISYVISGFYVSGWTVFTMTFLIVAVVLVNGAQNLIYKGDITDSIVSSFYLGIMLSSVVMFTLMSDVQILDIIKSIGHLFTTMSMNGVSGDVVLQMFCQSVLVPTLYALALISIVRLYPKITSPETNVKEATKKLLIKNAVFWGIIVVVEGYINEYIDVMDYINIIFDHMIFVVMSALLFITSRNLESVENDKFQLCD